MDDFVFNIKGLTANDRAQWEKDNLNELKRMGYYTYPEERKDRFFKNTAFKNKFGTRKDYDTLKLMSPEQRDSLFNVSPDADIESLSTYQAVKNNQERDLNSLRSNDGKLIGSSRREWENFDSFLQNLSPYYKRYKGTEYFPIDDNKKVEMMSDYAADASTFGEDIASQKMADRIQDEVSHNQPLTDKIWRGFTGMGANAIGGTIAFAGHVLGGLAALTGIDRLTGENQKEGYLDNLFAQAIDNPWTRYGNQVMEQGTMFTEDDPEKAYNLQEIIRTSDEDKSLLSNIFSRNTIPEVMQQSGFTLASMLEGAGLAKIGNMAFNTARYATLAGKAAATAEKAEKINRTLGNIAKWQRRYNAYAVPALVGQGEGALNALNTKQDFLEDAKRQIQQAQHDKFNELFNQRMEEELNKAPLLKLPEGKASKNYKEIEKRVSKEVWDELQPMYEDAMNKMEEEADDAALTNFIFNSGINGVLNVTLKAPMFGGKVTEALRRSRVGKLFADNDFIIDKTGKVVAKELTKKQILGRMAKETLGEGMEEYSQDITDAFSQGVSNYDLTDYIKQRYSGKADEAISDSLSGSLAAGLMAAGKKAVSKDALQSGIYGALGQMIGTPNVNAMFSKADRVSLNDKKGFKKVTAALQNIYRLPMVESYRLSQEENANRRKSADALNEWLDEGNNRDKLTSLKGSLNWAASMQKAADEGDEFSFRNSRLGKQIQDYFMLEQLKGTPLYESFVQRYMDITDAQEGDKMAQDIAKYDDRPLAEVQKDAQNMLNVMKKVQEASADLERSLGKSIPQETKQALIYGKLSLEDWKERASQIEDELNNTFRGSTSSLTEDQRNYIARRGTSKAPSAPVKETERIQQRIETLEKNKEILTDNQKEDLKGYKKALKNLNKEYDKAVKEYEKLGFTDKEAVLTEGDIMALSPRDRYTMLNPKNKSGYSEKQQEVIEHLKNKMTAGKSDFMNTVEDAARIQDAQEAFLSQYNAALQNPKILTNIENHLKFQGRMENLRNSYKKLNEIKDYETFAKELDDVYSGGDPLTVMAANEALKDNPFYSRYNTEDTEVSNISKQLYENEAFKNVDPKNKALVTEMTRFLSRKGVDIKNPDAVSQALLSQDENGQSLLTSYINEVNEKSPEKISLDDIGKTVDAYQKAVQALNRNESEKAEINAQPERKSSSPAPPPSIFDSMYKSAEEAGKAASEETPEGSVEETPVEGSEQPDVTLSMSDEAINNNSDNPQVMNTMEASVSFVKDLKSPYSEEAKQRAMEELNTLTSPKYESEQDFRDTVAKRGQELSREAKGGSIEEQVGSILERAARAQGKTAYKNNSPSETIKNNSSPKSPQGSNNTSQNNTQSTPQSSNNTVQNSGTFIHLVLPSQYTPFLNEIMEKHGVMDFLKSGKISTKSGNRTTAVFMVSPDITEGVSKEMGDYYDAENDLPVLICAEIKDEKGKVIRYQPIGVLPASSRDANAAKIRKLALSQGITKGVISNGNMTLRTGGIFVESPALGISKSKETDTDLRTLIQRTSGNKKEEAKKMARNFIIDKNDKGIPTLYYMMPTGKGDGSTTRLPVLTNAVKDTKNEEGKTVNEVDNPVMFNSRTLGFSNKLRDTGTLKGKISLTSDGILIAGSPEAQRILDNIDNVLSRYIYPSDGKYSIRGEVIDGKLGLSLYLGNDKLGIITSDLNNPQDITQNAAGILKNLFKHKVNWQVEKSGDYLNPSSEYYDAHLGTMANLINDGILRIGVNSLERVVSGVRINTPKGLNITSPSVTVNSDNAVFSDTNTEANTQSGERVDPDTGFTESGESPKNSVTPEYKEAEAKVHRIEEDSQKLKLSDDERVYTDDEGNTYARVTSVIQADEEASGRFDPTSPWIAPSTTIGNSVDEFVRAFFEGKEKTDLPVATPAQWKEFMKELQEFKNDLTNRGYTIIPRDIMAIGSVQVTMEDGSVQTIPVAGTLDILAYDAQGNFHIFDMKTHHAKDISEEKMNKYRRQLSLYKRFLEDRYGIQVKTLNIIPVKVEYPNPDKHNTYEVKDGELYLNGNKYKDARPTLSRIINIREMALNARYDRLEDYEKELIDKAVTGKPKEIKVQEAENIPASLTSSKTKRKSHLDKHRRPIPRKTDGTRKAVNPLNESLSDLNKELMDITKALYGDSYNDMSSEEQEHAKGCLE